MLEPTSLCIAELEHSITRAELHAEQQRLHVEELAGHRGLRGLRRALLADHLATDLH
jgi:hypothetical protein